MDKKAYCLGIGCHKNDRKYTCIECKTHVCSLCVAQHKKKHYCIDCYIEYKCDTLNTDYTQMLKKLHILDDTEIKEEKIIIHGVVNE